MRVHVGHELGRGGARQKLSGFVEQSLTQAWPAGVTVSDATRSWTGDRLDFAFTASRGFFSLPIRGWLDVADSEVILDAEVPAMLSAFVGEERVREVLAGELQRILREP